MPLLSGKSRNVVGHNIRELEISGYSHKQAVAIAMRKAYGTKKLVKKPQKRGRGKRVK